MGDVNTSLVDTTISREAAPKAAREVYDRLVQHGVIVPRLESGDGLPYCLAECAFPVRDDYRGFDDLEGWGAPKREVDTAAPLHANVTAIEIEVTGYRWLVGANGAPELLPSPFLGPGLSPGDYGLFMNFEGGFSVNCPHCAMAIELGGEGRDDLADAINAWCITPESSSLGCSTCGTSAPLPAWRSNNHEFAAGHLAITAWGEHLLGLTERPSSASARFVKALLGDPDAIQPAVVFCNI
jgi:hypothetical protein